MIEARMAELVRQLEAADTHRASLEAQLRTTHSARRSDGPVTLAYVKGMAAELTRALDRIVPNMTPSNLPMARTPSEIPTPRPRSDRPRR